MEQDDELIYKKLSGALTADEALLFDHRLAMDEAFAEEYAFQWSAVEQLAQSEGLMKEKLQRAYRAVQSKRQRRQQRGRWMAAAAVVLLLGLGAYLWGTRPAAAPLFEQYYTLYQPYPAVRGASPEASLASALRYYQQGNYAEAAIDFQALPSSATRALYLGNCYWQLGEVATARSYFDTAQTQGDAILRQHAEWYLVLCHLRQGDLIRVKEGLRRVLNQQGLYYKEAQQLQADLAEVN